MCFLALAVLTLLIASLVLLVRNRMVDHLINLPDEKEVVSIRAVAYLDKIGGTEPTPEFAVPRDYIPVILAVLKPATTYYRNGSSGFPPVCDLQIATNSQRLIEVRVEWSGQNLVRFTADGVHCRRSGPYCLRDGFGIDESLSLRALLEGIYFEQITHTKRKYLASVINDLEWSTGRRQLRNK
jgi:hypothetical protein